MIQLKEFLKENPIHTVIDDPIDITYMPEKEALDYYRDVLATWYYIMMEKYGQTTRKKLLNGHTMNSVYEDILKYMVSTIDRYDSEFRKRAAYHPKEIVKPEDVYESIANITPTKDNILHQQYAKKLVLTRKKEDYQSRF